MQMNNENQTEKKPYPKSVFFIITNEFCERFSYYGMKTVLALYLSGTLHYSQDEATILYHLFSMLCYFFPLFGAIIADSFWGKFNTILYLSVVYACGNVVLSFASVAIPMVPIREISLLGLLMISVGTGGIKPCVSSFGGDQFVLPEQALQLQRFFSIFYFSINAGSLISTFFTPILRNNVKCFDQETCFPLAFGTPSVLMIVSVVIFVCGKKLYVIKKPKENVITIFFKCIARALRNKFFRKNETYKKDCWLNYADDEYSQQQISDIRAVLNVLYLFIPVPLFWALFDQQGSRWTFQATNMDGRVFGYDIKPDQMQVMNPFLILLFIPIFELYVYPILQRVGIRRPLQKLTLGGFLAAISFVISAYLEFYVEKSYAVLPSANQGQMRIFNALNCDVRLTSANPALENVDRIGALSSVQFLHVLVNKSTSFTVSVSVSEADESCQFEPLAVELKIYKNKMISYFIAEKSERKLFLYEPAHYDAFDKNENGMAKIRIFFNSIDSSPATITFKSNTDPDTTRFNVEGQALSAFHLIHPARYDVIVNEKTVLRSVEINLAEIDTLLLSRNETELIAKILNLVPPNDIHMLWQLPQIIIITAAEIMFSITGLEFSFTQAPESMKSVLSSAWLLTVAFGNLIVVVISEIKIFNSQAYEFLLFAGLMLLDMLLFIILSLKYQYVAVRKDSTTFDDDLKNRTTRTSQSASTSLSDLNS